MDSRIYRRGFTIVELLIVIVVIGILAAITVVAFNGVSDRAYVNRTNATAQQIGKTIKLYQVQNGDWPQPLGNWCIGTAADYPASDGFVAGACSRGTTDSGTPAAFLSTELNTISPGLTGKDVKPATLDAWTVVYRGYHYRTVMPSGGRLWGELRWYFQGNKDCGAGVYKEIVSNATYCRLDLAPS